tara:strand:+ start:5148 stop:5288 length:141 start_codon:yes stop_codon:yes gene_type:complete
MVKKVNITVSDEVNDKLKRIQHRKKIRTKDEAFERIIDRIDENILD